MLTVLAFIGGIVMDIFVFVFGIRIVKIGFRWTKTAMNRVADSVDEKIKNYKSERKEAKPEYNRYVKVDGTVK